MDYARKIGKQDEPKKWQKRICPILKVRDDVLDQTHVISEDRRLINWKNWLENHNKEYRHIKSKTGRDQSDQLISSSDKIRPLIEMRNLMEYATIPAPVIPDKYRGGPEFWKAPQVLSNYGNPCLPDVAAIQSKKDLNVNPELMYVKLPSLLEKEKNLAALSQKEPLWKRSVYLQKRKSQLDKEIKLLVPEEPIMDNLVIQGHGPRRRKKELRIPPITIWAPEDEESDENPEQTIILKIQDEELKWRKSLFEAQELEQFPYTWKINFIGKINARMEEEIVFENKGNRVILYHWRNATYKSKSMQFERRISPFFFNKTKGVILLGQIVKLKVWFLPRTPGIFYETWRLLTDPVLCPSPLLFQFWAHADNSDSQGSNPNIEMYLDRCIRNSIIRDIINAIMEDVDYSKPLEPAYGTLFLECAMFETKNPLHYYHPSLLGVLCTIYSKAIDQDIYPWNMSLDDLRRILLKLQDSMLRDNLLLEYRETIKKCLRPTLPCSIGGEKHGVVYNLLCSFANRFEGESESIRMTCLVKNELGLHSGTENNRSSQDSTTSNSSRGKRGKRIINRSQSNQMQETNPIVTAELLNLGLYREVLYVRIYHILGNTVEQICAAIDSINRLRFGDK